MSKVPWLPIHTLMLVLAPFAIFGFWYFRRWEEDPKSPYSIMIRRFRIMLLISGIGGIIGLIRFLLMYR